MQNKELYDFKKFVNTLFYLTSNHLNTISDLLEHIKTLIAKNYKLNRQSKEIYEKMERLDQKLLYFRNNQKE